MSPPSSIVQSLFFRASVGMASPEQSSLSKFMIVGWPFVHVAVKDEEFPPSWHAVGLYTKAYWKSVQSSSVNW